MIPGMLTPKQFKALQESHKEWHPASGHPKGWRVCRGFYPMEELEDRRGHRILFKSHAAARKRADQLNRLSTCAS